ADLDRVAADVVDDLQFVVADDMRLVANGRIFGDAARELQLVAIAANLAHQVNRGTDREAKLTGGRVRLHRGIGDHADDRLVAAIDADEPTDSGAGTRRFRPWCIGKADVGL